MLASISKHCLRLRHNPIRVRTFLSEAFNLTETWNARLSNPILQKVKADNFYYELELKFNQQNTASPIDIDIYANKVTDDNHFDEIADLLNKLRKTPEATNILDSTGHAYIRNLLEYDQIGQIIQVLDNRIEYGVFLDDYLANLVIDKLLKAGKFKEAARISTIFMLQEDFSNPITRALSLFACYKYLGNPEVFDDLKPPVEPEAEAGQKKKKKKEEIKVRVKFLRNPYFDDHFDIKDSQHLVGKTLTLIGREYSKLGNIKIGNNVQLLGLAIYQKYEDAVTLLESCKGSELEKDVIEKINEFFTKVEEQQQTEAFHALKSAIELVGSSHKVIEGNFEEKLNELCKSVVQENEAKEIEQQKKIYSAWTEIREKRLKEEIERLHRAERLKNVEQLTKEMEAEERKLWFFENEDQIDLDIESKRVYYPKRWFGKRKVPRKADENYIPPDIDRRRN
uniref:CSON003897 protein n=1 Tax=Culicoides sonorensis TaxID=179676 RepID=A0A336LVR3_CULSO